MTFDDAFTALIGHEGGYTPGIGDPGGETKYGISKRAYPNVDIKNLTLDAAKAIYNRDYWIPAGCESVPDAVKFDLFDAAVNSGIVQAVKWLQQAAGVTADGKLGPISIAKTSTTPGAVLKARFNGFRLEFMTNLGTWDRFGKGWARRISANLKGA